MSDRSPASATYYIAMIGDSSTVRGFAAGGVHAYPAATSEQGPDHAARTAVRRQVRDHLQSPRRWRSRSWIPSAACAPAPVPAVIIVPDQSGARGIGFEKIRLAVERAIGIDLLGQARQRQAESNAATTTT